MTIRQRIQYWLGIEALHTQQDFMLDRIYDIGSHAHRHELNWAITNAALARLLAQIDPLYGTSEDDPIRRADSNRIGELAMKRLLGEVKASNREKF